MLVIYWSTTVNGGVQLLSEIFSSLDRPGEPTMACLHQEDLSKPVATSCWWRGCTDKLEYPNYGLMITKTSKKHALHLVPAYHTGCQYLGELVTRVGKSGAGPKASTPGVVGHLKEPNKLL